MTILIKYIMLYKSEIDELGIKYEFIYVTDSDSHNIIRELTELNKNGENHKNSKAWKMVWRCYRFKCWF